MALEERNAIGALSETWLREARRYGGDVAGGADHRCGKKVRRPGKSLVERKFDRYEARQTTLMENSRTNARPERKDLTSFSSSRFSASGIDYTLVAKQNAQSDIRLATTFNLAFGFLPCPIDRFPLAYPEIMVEVIGTLDGFSTIHPDQFDLALRRPTCRLSRASKAD